MQEGKRQRQIAGVIQEGLNEIFRTLGLNMIEGGLVSIASVKITPDLLEARIYISLFKAKHPDAAMQKIEDRAWEIKRELAEKIRHQVRRIPVLQFFKDDTLEYVFKMEEVFEKIKKDQVDNLEEDKKED